MRLCLRRREFIAGLGGAVAWPLAVPAQQPERMRLIGMLLSSMADDAVFQTWVGAFLQGLAQLDWIIGRNVRIDPRWAGAKADDIRKHAQELVALVPDVILAHGSSTVGPLLQLTRSIPIVFPVVVDPVGAGYVESLARPGGNATGFMSSEFSVDAKFLELLKGIAPRSREWLSFGMPPKALEPARLPSSRPWRHCSGSRQIRSTCVKPERSKALSRNSRTLRVAV